MPVSITSKYAASPRACPDRIQPHVCTRAEFLDNIVKGSVPIQIMKMGLGEELWREKEKLALAWLKKTLPTLKGSLTSDA
ncbi:MAG: hypothetical protein HY938_07955 [Nitrosomonadales bacterium]|nr:hypothetical protein [Nitrosomonadales bacterium]